MKVCMLSNVHSTDDIRILEKEARSLSALGHRALPRRILTNRSFAKLKKYFGEISSRRATT